MKKLGIILLVLLLLCAPALAETDQQVKKITIPEKNITLAPGVHYQLTVIGDPADVSIPPLAWSSSNEKVATVDDAGMITCRGKGSAKIKAVAADGGKLQASVNVKVEQFDLVFTSKRPQKAKYRYSGSGRLQVNGSVKNGNVCIPDNDIDMNTTVVGGAVTDGIEVTPLHPGTDVVTLNINGKRFKYSVFVADYYADYEIQYVEMLDTTPDKLNGSFQDVIYGTPYSEVKRQLMEKYGDDISINDYGYRFEITYNQPEIIVAGHNIEAIMFGFCYGEDMNGFVTKEEDTTCFCRAKYIFSYEPNDSVFENLHIKLNELYGKANNEDRTPEAIRDMIKTNKYNWSDNDIYIDLDNSSGLSISYLWGKGFSNELVLRETLDYLKKVEEQKKRDEEQDQFSTSIEGL